MPANHTKVGNSALQGLMGQRVTVRYTVDESERRGIVGAFDAANNKIRIDQGKGHFWITGLDTPAHYIFLDNL